MPVNRYSSGLLLIVFILFGIYCFVLGDSGILERMKLLKAKEDVQNNISVLQKDNERLQKQYSIISDSRGNSIFYKKEASGQGYITEGEKYIFFKNKNNQVTAKRVVEQKKEKYKVELFHLRILWAAVSIMIILLYFGKKSKGRRENKEA